MSTGKNRQETSSPVDKLTMEEMSLIDETNALIEAGKLDSLRRVAQMIIEGQLIQVPISIPR